jgi:multiple sugar transport system ATP-binding protein
MASIRFEQVSKRYGKVTAVAQADFEVKDKEFMVLVGPSGCGKSTLLRMIAGLEDISEGSLFIGGERVNDLPPKDRDIAIVFQNYALYPHMTVYDNLAFGLKIRGLKKEVIREKVLEAARILEIEALLDRKPKAMSGGQLQRVAIGRAIVRNPKVFLFDEPLSNLDAKLRGQMRLEIARLHKKLQTTVVYVTHDQVEAMTLGDRIAVMQQGIIQQIDTPQNLYRRPANRFVAGFIGSPPMNFIPGAINKSSAAWESHTGRRVEMGLRPEHFSARPPQDGLPHASFEVEVQHIERLGHESFAFAQWGKYALAARLSADEDLEPPCRITLWAALDKMHFFDLESGKVVDYPPLSSAANTPSTESVAPQITSSEAP